MVANDKAEMVKYHEHIAYIIDKDRNISYCAGKLEISHQLLSILNK